MASHCCVAGIYARIWVYNDTVNISILPSYLLNSWLSASVLGAVDPIASFKYSKASVCLKSLCIRTVW